MKLPMRNRAAKIFALLVIFMSASAFNRDPNSPQKDCLDCHDTITKALHERYVHYPAEMKQCDACHNAETFKLTEQVPDLCTVCHRDFRKEQQNSLHPVVDDCTGCHNPHGSQNPKLLLQAIPDLCLNCHEPLPKDTKEVQSIHPPVDAGECLSCHAPHSSLNPRLLLQASPELCKGCHDVDDAGFNRKHLGLLKPGTDCLSCHGGHYSKNKSLLLENSHPPFAEGMCDSCHDTSAQGKFVASGTELCTGCHDDIGALTQAQFPHPAAADDCLNCHRPHASPNKTLLTEPKDKLCGECHDTSIAAGNTDVHPPFAAGRCAECHSPHGSDVKGMLAGPESEICLKCHTKIKEALAKQQPHTAVEQGCTSCHQPHQSPRKKLLKAEGESLCQQCHDLKEKEQARFVHYPYGEGACSTCHLPHSGEGVGHLTKDVEHLCTMCHREKHKDFPHPVNMKPSSGFLFAPESRLNFGPNDTLVCTTCHFPHTSDTVFLLKIGVTGGDLCYQCHRQ